MRIPVVLSSLLAMCLATSAIAQQPKPVSPQCAQEAARVALGLFQLNYPSLAKTVKIATTDRKDASNGNHEWVFTFKPDAGTGWESVPYTVVMEYYRIQANSRSFEECQVVSFNRGFYRSYIESQRALYGN
jgi:hypothetical protein